MINCRLSGGPLIITVTLLIALVACSPESVQQAEKEGADLILTNGRVYTLRWG